jgi:PAS domain S-box-containing protein
MRTFIERALRKLPKMTAEQITALLLSVAAENERLESVIDSLTEGLLVCDANHDLILVNKAAERLLPLSPYEQGERPLWVAVADEAVADFLKDALIRGDRVTDREFEVEVKGVQRLLSLTVLPLVKDRKVTGSLIHVEDITEKRGKEARLRRAENLASLTTLAAGVAHEIKNPLGSISIHIQLIQKALKASRAACEDSDERPTAETATERSAPAAPFQLLDKYLAVVNEEIDRLNRIVVDFLFAVRPMDIDLREGDLNGLIRELVEFVRYELEAAKIVCDLRLSPDLPGIRYDERYIKQALLNLVKNAVAAMPSGGTLTIRTVPAGDEVRLSVSDTGIGIPEENLPKIFEPYFTTKESGSGLGLTLVFKIIKEHRGEITVKSKEGEGTAFTIILPVPQKETRLIAFGGEAE